MKEILLATLGIALVGCVTSRGPETCSGDTQISIYGNVGAAVTGHYIKDGRQIEVSNALPWRVTVPRLSELQLRKTDVADAVIVGLQYKSADSNIQITETLAPGTTGIRVKVRNGFISKTF